MKQRLVFFVLFLLSLAFGLAVGAALAQQKPKMPADFPFEQVGKSPGKVTFNHEKHFDQGVKCTDCHVKVFKMKRGTTEGPFTMARMEKGELCGACHSEGKQGPKGQPVFSAKDAKTCARCHIKG